MIGLTLLAGAVGIAGRILSPAVVLDVVALWPLGVLALAVDAILRRRRRLQPRLAAVVPLLLLTWLLVGAGAHLSGWRALPSAAADQRIASVEGITQARLQLRATDAVLVVEPTTELLATVEMIRRGGDVHPPAVGLAVEGDRVAVVVEEASEGGWFRFAGWRLGLAGDVTWVIELSGRGTATLGRLGAGTRLRTQGEWRVVVPRGQPVRVLGEAEVPADWEPIPGGSRAPAEGEGWILEPERGPLVVGTR